MQFSRFNAIFLRQMVKEYEKRDPRDLKMLAEEWPAYLDLLVLVPRPYLEGIRRSLKFDVRSTFVIRELRKEGYYGSLIIAPYRNVCVAVDDSKRTSIQLGFFMRDLRGEIQFDRRLPVLAASPCKGR